MKHLVTILLAALLFNPTADCQNDFFDEPILKVSVFTHSIGIPFKDYVKRPLNLGLSVGVRFAYNKDSQNPLMQEIELSWFNHRHLNKALLVKTNLSKSFFTDSGLFVAPEIGIGYIMDITENAAFKLDESGTYTRSSGISHGFVTQLSVSLGRRFSRENKNDLVPFLKYESMLQFPYSEFTPFLPHTMLHVGSKIFLSEN